MFTIYLITNQNNGKMYVGKTHKTIDFRWKRHLKSARLNSQNPIHRAIRKYNPENFTIKQIDCTENEQQANWLESFYIGILQAQNPIFGYNICSGGEGFTGARHSEETKRKIGAAGKGRPSAMLGKKHTEEAKEKMRFYHKLNPQPSCMKGKQHSEASKKKMSAARTGEGNPMYGTDGGFFGKKHSEETKNKMSVVQKGHIVTEETKENIRLAKQKDLPNTKILELYNQGLSHQKIAKLFGVSGTTIGRRIKEKTTPKEHLGGNSNESSGR